jgi:transposase InsO family protein
MTQQKKIIKNKPGLLENRGIQPGMGSKGGCYDNAITEVFLHTLKTELIYFGSYQTREGAKSSIFEYIEVFYKRQRRHSALCYKTPVDFENELNYLNSVSSKSG